MTTEILSKKFKGHELPFLLVTNGGMMSEQQKADKLNKILQIDGLIKEKHIVQSHTPLGEKALVDKYKHQVILVAGVRGTQTELAENYNLH